MRLPVGAVLLAAVCGVLIGGGEASARSTANSQTFTDATGDNQSSSSTNYASDIRSVNVTSTDTGTVHISTTLADADARLVEGDAFDVFIDTDRNRSTGGTGSLGGIEVDLVADGHSSGGTTFFFCSTVPRIDCQEGPTDWAHDQQTATGLHAVDFYITMSYCTRKACPSGISRTSTCAFDFRAQEAYTQPGGSTTLYDWLPSPSTYATFNLNADPDRDGLCGYVDKCPTAAATGIFDRNNNGCKGPYSFLQAQPHAATTGGPAGTLHVLKAWITGAPPGASVTFSSPSGSERLVANSSGKATSRKIARGGRGSNFRYGSSINIRVTKRGFVGNFLKLVAKPSGLALLKPKCIPATGGAAVKCSSKLKGK
jgi:hypothetical protein